MARKVRLEAQASASDTITGEEVLKGLNVMVQLHPDHRLAEKYNSVLSGLGKWIVEDDRRMKYGMVRSWNTAPQFSRDS